MNKQLIHQKFALRWMRLVSLSFIIFHLSFSASAQTRVEWFFDQDPGMGSAQQALVNADGEGNVEFAPSTVGLSAGHHLLGVRIVNTDAEQKTSYGPTLLQDVLVPHTDGSQLVTRVEYFWDKDPGVGKGTALPVTAGAEVNLDNIEIPTDGLENDTHLLGIRAYGNHGWGPTMTQQVVVMHEPLKVTFVEYFWDEDPGWGKGTPLPVVAANELDLNGVELSTAELPAGLHRLGIRARGGSCWSPTVYLDTYVPLRTDAVVAQGEYFWDDDPGYGAGTPISMTPGQEVNIDALGISTEDLATGWHQLFVRYRGTMGWSPTLCNEVIVMPGTKVLGAEYFWNEDPGYGCGTPVDITPGEEVSLNALGIPTADIHGDALFCIRYRGPFGWSATLSYKVMLDAEGNYTLNAQAATSLEDRNYQSLTDVVSDFADRGVGNHVVFTLPTSNTSYVLDATSEEIVTQLQAVKASIDNVSTARETKTIAFTAASGSGNSLDITTTTNGLPTVVSLFAHTRLENVELTINGTACDFTAVTERSQELCSQETTQAVDLTSISSSLTATFTAQPHSGTTIVGYEAQATGTLPVMALANIGMKTDSLAYLVALSNQENTVLATYTYYIYVRPRVSEQTFTMLQPAKDSSLDPGRTTLRWSDVSGAVGYRVTVKEGDTVLDGFPVETASTTCEVTIVSGHSYTWQVTAIGLCDELAADTIAFSARLLPDLAVTDINLPEGAQAGNTVVVTATITNQGEGATTETSWTDRLHYAIDSDNFQQFVKAAEVTHTGVLGIGESYEVSFSFTAPQVEEGQLRVFVVTDAENNVMEANDANNRTLSATSATMAPFYVNANDLAVLRSLYNELGGSSWNGTKWDATSELIRPGNWSGVTFDAEGCVTAINLQNRNLTGGLSSLCALTLPQLNSLNLSRNALTGDVSAFLTDVPQLTSVNLSYNQLGNLSTPLPATITSLNMTYQHRNADNWYGIPGIDVHESVELNVGRGITASLPSLVSYNHGAQAFNTHPKINLLGRSDYIHYGTLVWNVVSETYTYEPNVNLLTATQDAEVLAEPQSGSAQYGRYPAYLHFTLGDANLSGWVDVNDVQLTLNYIMNDYRNIGLWAANTFTEDETSTVINIQDIVCTVNIVLDNESVASSRRRAMNRVDAAQEEPAVATFYTDSRKLMVETTEEIGAFDLELSGIDASQVKLLLNSRQWQMQTRNTQNGVRMVVFSPTGETLPVGTTQLLRLGGSAEPVAVQATSPDAEELAATVGAGIPTGITGNDREAMSGDGEALYDLSGRKVNSGRHLRKGIYINNGKKIKK